MRCFYFLLRTIYLISIISLTQIFVWAANRGELIITSGDSAMNNAANADFRKNLVPVVEEYLFAFYILAAIGMSIYIGFRLFMSRGNDEEMKNAMNALIYAAIGIAIVPAAYAAIKIANGLTYNAGG